MRHQAFRSEASLGRGAMHDVQTSAQQAWDAFLGPRPLLYLAGRTPHGECDPRLHTSRRLWTNEELRAFDQVVDRRTESLLHQQRRVLEHWERSATRIQAHVRGLVSRARAQRMRQVLLGQARQVQQARELAALCRRRHLAACRIQHLYRRHCEHRHFIYRCRVRLLRVIGLFIFKRRRHQAARVLQRAVRRQRGRQRLRQALRVLVKMLRRSRQKEALEKAAQTFAFARTERISHDKREMWSRWPQKMVHARRVQARRGEVAQVKAELRTSFLPPLSNDTPTRTEGVTTRYMKHSVLRLPAL